jgi:hypothetical protein
MRLSSAVTLASLSLIADHAVSQQPVCLQNNAGGECLDDNPCGLWLAESSLFRGRFGLFSGVDVQEGETVGEGDVVVPIYDANQNEWSLWHDIVWDGDIQDDLLLQNYYQLEAFIPGLGSNALCSEPLASVSSRRENHMDSLGVHRSKDASAGSFSYRHQFEFYATKPLAIGQELFTSCSDMGGGSAGNGRRLIKPLPWLQENGICVDNISVQSSTLPGVGRGAFAKRRIEKGEIIVSSPVIHFDRSQTEIVKQFQNEDGGLEYTEHVEQHQLLLNYCYGHPNSTVLMLPYAPGVNFINHHSEPNAILDWSESPLMDENILDLTASDALEEHNGRLIVDYVALRDIEAGEELFMDYGRDWEKAWEMHVETWESPKDSENYSSAAEYKQTHPDELIRTVDEQKENPYPENIVTACMYLDTSEELDEDEYDAEAEVEAVYWTSENEYCLRPCKIVERQVVKDKAFYTVVVEEITNKFSPEYCDLSHERQNVLRTPARAITLVDKEYTTDQHLKTSFRHEIGVPEDLYPEDWMWEDPEPMGDFELSEMKPGQIEQIKWADSGEVATPHAHVIGLSPQVRIELLKYCDRLGITERFRELTYRGNSLRPGKDENIELQGLNWYVQRPESHWKSNMHWISPMDGPSHDDYLRALSAAGFDDVLKHIGEHFGLEGLACYHITFIAVSYCTQGYLHYDISDTGAKVFNVIVPLILANETGPELDVQADRETNYDPEVGRLRYQYDVASMMGDDAYHATSAVDYRVNKEMRMAATVYIGDISEDNIDAILSDYTQNYPPKSRPDILMKMAGTHWQRNNPDVRLPEPSGPRWTADAK